MLFLCRHGWNEMCQEAKDSMKASSLELIAAVRLLVVHY